MLGRASLFVVLPVIFAFWAVPPLRITGAQTTPVTRTFFGHRLEGTSIRYRYASTIGLTTFAVWGGGIFLLFAAARADHVERLIRPALADGKWVICDRFVDSSRAYQGGGGGLSDADILALHGVGSGEGGSGEGGSGGLLPDVTLLIEVSPEVAAARLARRDVGGADRIGGREAAYHARVAAAFAALAEAEPARFARIAGDDAPEAIHSRILAALAPLLP